jgi:hypothetical protein
MEASDRRGAAMIRNVTIELAVPCIALVCAGCGLLDGDESKSPLEEVYALVEDDFDYDAVKPLGTYYAPGTILDDEDATITATVEDCFGSEAVLSTITTDTILNANWEFESKEAAGGVASSLIGAKVSVDVSKVKTLYVEVATVDQEMISETEIDRKTRSLGIDADCRRRIENGEHRIVMAAIRVEGLRLSVKTQEGVTISLDSGNLSKYVHVEATLQESVVSHGTIAPAEPVYVGFRATTLWALPDNPYVAPAPAIPPELEPVQRDEPALWCCDRYGRARCALDQPGTLDAICQCDADALPGSVCEAEADELATAANAELDIEDPCTVISGGPTVACGATLSPALDPNTLFLCHDRQTLGAAPCATRCQVATAGAHDFCEDADPCANATRDGATCGANLAPEPWALPSTLYECRSRQTVQQQTCNNTACVTGGAGMDDFCFQPSPPGPGPGGSPPTPGS